MLQLNLNRPGAHLYLRAAGPEAVTVIDRTLTKSFALSPERALEDWPVRSVAQIDQAAIEALLALDPEVVVLGTGARIAFPPVAVQAAFLTRRVGFEVMDNAAAARTFNVLASEGRRVVAAFVLPG